MSLLSDEHLFFLHTGASFFMMGLIWFVQVVHYPLMVRVGSASFTWYHFGHTRRTSWVVILPMLIELSTGVWLWASGAITHKLFEASLALLALVWMTTFLIQVPLHHGLSKGYDKALLDRLILSNWIRTALWTARAVLLGFAFL
jgi:hypothetical protein